MSLSLEIGKNLSPVKRTVDFEVGDTVRVHIAGDAQPPEGLIVCSPLNAEPIEITIDGKVVEPVAGEIRVDHLPAEIALRYR